MIDHLNTNLFSPGVYINDFKVKKSQFTIHDIGIINTTIDDFISKTLSFNFTMSDGKLYPHLKGTYLNENVEIAIHPSNSNEISELYIYFSAFSNLKEAVALCNNISEQIEDIYGAMINTYFFDTTDFSSQYDQRNLNGIPERLSYTDIYIWLITGTKHEVINLCLEYLSKKRNYVPVLKVKVKKLTGCSLPSKRNILYSSDILLLQKKNKPNWNSKFLGIYKWYNIEKENIQLISPIDKLAIIKRRPNVEKEDIYNYNEKVQESYFKVQNDFLSGVFYDLSDTSSYASYAFILFFSILDAFKYDGNDKDVSKLINQIDILCICCPKIKQWLLSLIGLNKIYRYFDDNAKLQLINWEPDFKNWLSIPDYANLILKRKNDDLKLLKEFCDIPISWFCLCKTYAIRYKISNDILLQDMLEMFLIVLRKFGGIGVAINKSIIKLCIGNREPHDIKEECKIQNIHNDIMRYDHFSCFYSNFLQNFINQVKLKNNIVIDVPTEVRWWQFECVGFEQCLNEAISEYYSDKEPQKGHIPVPRKKKASC